MDKCNNKRDSVDKCNKKRDLVASLVVEGWSLRSLRLVEDLYHISKSKIIAVLATRIDGLKCSYPIYLKQVEREGGWICQGKPLLASLKEKTFGLMFYFIHKVGRI